MKLATFAKHWKAIVGAIVVTVGAVAGALGWLDSRIQSHVRQATARNLQAINMLRCELKEVPLLDCDIHRGMDE